MQQQPFDFSMMGLSGQSTNQNHSIFPSTGIFASPAINHRAILQGWLAGRRKLVRLV